MSDDTSAALIAQLDVKFDQLASNMKKAMTVFDNGGRALEKRQAQIKKNLSNWAIDFSGIGGINKALIGLTGAAVVGGIADLVKKSLDAATAIGDVAQQSGFSVEKLQQLRFAASQSGASFGIMDDALTTLNKNLGDFINTGTGRGALAFKQLGIDKLINSGQVRDAETAFDAIIKKIGSFSSEAQKSSLLAGIFGKEAGPKLLQLVNQGAQGIADLEAKAISLGIVLSSDTVRGAKDAADKLDALFSVMKAQGVAAVVALAPEIATLAQNVTNGLPDLITWVEKWAQWFGLIKLSPVDALKVQLADAQKDLDALQGQADDFKNSGFFTKAPSSFLSIFGLGKSDAEFDALIADKKAKIDKLKDDISLAPVTITPAIKLGGGRPPALHVGTTAAEIEKAKRLKETQAAALAQTGVDAATASAALTAAQDATSLQLLKGTADYYAAVKKQADDEYNAAVQTATAETAKRKAELLKQVQDKAAQTAGIVNIDAALKDKISEADEKRKQKLFDNGPGPVVQQAIEQSRQLVQQYGDETAALGLTESATARLTFIQQQLADARAKQIPITDDLIASITAEGDAVGTAAQAHHDATQSMQANIAVADNLRGGLVDIGTTALTQASSFKDAVGQMLLSLAQLIVKLELTKIAQEALGESGTSLGFLSSLFGSAGGGLDATGTLDSSGILIGAGYASGGYTGPGGRDQPAGVVHRGEYVFDQKAVRRIGIPALQAMQMGYANGGYVGLAPPSLPSMGPARSTSTTVVQQFDLRGAMVDKDVWANVNQIASAHAATAGKAAVNAALKPHVLGPAMDRAKGARASKSF